MREISKKQIQTILFSYNKMLDAESKEDIVFFKHLVANELKDLANIDSDKKKRDFTKEEKERVDALSLCFYKNLLEKNTIRSIIDDLEFIGYSVVDE